ncbi:MAG: hypothetical protein JHD03_07400, partial [Solirubrobacteraceae bacterium]|nr:hypothetical protein [Solirubrobacteraceae bacterium]
MGQAIKERALPAAIVAAALLTLAPTAGAASKAKPAAGNVAARQVVLLRNDGRRAKLAPQRLVLSGSKSVAYASFNVPKAWAGKPTSLILEAQSKVRVTVSAVRAGELRSLRWSDRPRTVGAAVSTNLLAATPTAVALPQLPSSGRLVLEIRGRGRAVITGALQISPRTGSSQPSVGGGDETPGSGGGSDVGDRPSDEEPIPGQTPAEPGSPSDPDSPS